MANKKKKKVSKGVRILRTVLCILLALLLIGTAVAPAFAAQIDDLKNEKARLENEAAANQGEQGQAAEELESLHEDMNVTLGDIEALDKEIAECSGQMTTLKEKIASNEQRIEETQKKLEEAIALENEHYEQLKVRLQMSYEYGEVDPLDVLFGARDLTDFFSRIEYITALADYDKKIQDSVQKDREEIQDMEALLEKTRLDLDMNKVTLEQKQAELDEAMAEKQLLYAKLIADEQSKQEYMAYLEEQEAALKAMITSKAGEIASEEARLAAIEEARRAAEEAARRAAEEEEARRRQQEEEERRRQEEEPTPTPTPTPQPSSGYFIWPVPSSGYISSEYGWRVHPITGDPESFHDGIDIGADYGQYILAADSGEVSWACWDGGYGNAVGIVHSSGYITVYGHCSEILVYNGQYVNQGDVIALIGSTGNSTGPHCHFEIRTPDGGTVNPLYYLG